MRTRLLAALLGLLALTAACGGGQTGGSATPGETRAGTPADTPTETTEVPTAEPTTTTAAAAAVKPCEILPKSDAEALAGTPLGDGVEGIPENPQCTYTGPPEGPLAQVEVYIGDGAKKTYDIDRELGEMAPVAGLADEAYYRESKVYFRKATTWVVLALVNLKDPAENRQSLESLAARVAGRL
jgi:hypothetical protein